MSHNEVFKIFKKIFPQYVNDDLIYFPAGKNCIRIRGIEGYSFHGRDFIFAYDSHSDWKFETLESFLQEMSKRREEQ